MIGIRIRRAGRNQERSGRRGGGRYAIADGLCVLLTVEALTEAARRQWPTKKDTFSWRLGVWHLSRGHEEEARQTIRVGRISSSRMQLSRVDNIHYVIDARTSAQRSGFERKHKSLSLLDDCRR
jgi:hypothetical protein